MIMGGANAQGCKCDRAKGGVLTQPARLVAERPHYRIASARQHQHHAGNSGQHRNVAKFGDLQTDRIFCRAFWHPGAGSVSEKTPFRRQDRKHQNPHFYAAAQTIPAIPEISRSCQ